MKDLLEVIEEGREGLEKFSKYIDYLSEQYKELEKKDLVPVTEYPISDNVNWQEIKEEAKARMGYNLTSHTKAILTNVVERLRLEKRDQDAPKEGDPHFTGCGGCGADYPAICGCREVNHALQTQIDYLEDILEKLG